uniref:Uncharacterized protein n=1 Tax=Bursaphelenchus xylophilus TaxID=6326 RepID=A0A1I7S1K9_BURXY
MSEKSEQEESTSTHDECRVCGTTPASSHFGINSCRSCAAFFRRSIVLNRKYSCRFGGECDIEKDARTTCAHCRLKKCLTMGMETKNIRHYFDKNGPRSARSSISHSEKSERIYKTSPVPTPPSAPQQVDPHMPSLVTGYRKYLEDTKTLYIALHPENVFTQEITFKLVTIEEHAQFDRACIVYYVKMLNEYFRPFIDFTREEKMTIVEKYHLFFSLLNQNYLNTLYFSDDKSKLLLSYGNYVVRNGCAHFFSKTTTDIDRSFVNVRDKFHKIADKFIHVRPDETEVAALAGILLWREANSLYPDRGYDLILEQILAELCEYCKLKYGTLTYGLKFGTLMCLLRDLEDSSATLNESMFMGILIVDKFPPANIRTIFT